MINWLKNLLARHLTIENQTIRADTVQQADTINNIITAMINIPKKIVLGVALLLVILIVAVWAWFGNMQTAQEKLSATVIEGQNKIITQAKKPTMINQTTEGNNSAATIEKVNLKNKNVKQSTKGDYSPAIIRGTDIEDEK